jgi:hypothetical protein
VSVSHGEQYPVPTDPCGTVCTPLCTNRAALCVHCRSEEERGHLLLAWSFDDTPLETGPDELVARRDGIVPDTSGRGRGGHLGRMTCPAQNELRYASVNALQPRATVLPAVPLPGCTQCPPSHAIQCAVLTDGVARGALQVPWVLPSTAPVVRVGAPVVVPIVHGSNLIVLPSHDPDGDPLSTIIVRSLSPSPSASASTSSPSPVP